MPTLQTVYANELHRWSYMTDTQQGVRIRRIKSPQKLACFYYIAGERDRRALRALARNQIEALDRESGYGASMWEQVDSYMLELSRQYGQGLDTGEHIAKAFRNKKEKKPKVRKIRFNRRK